MPLSSQVIGAGYGWVMAALGLGTVLGGLVAIRPVRRLGREPRRTAVPLDAVTAAR